MHFVAVRLMLMCGLLQSVCCTGSRFRQPLVIEVFRAFDEGTEARSGPLCSMCMNRNQRETQSRSDTDGTAGGGTVDLTSWRTEKLARTARFSRSYATIVVYSLEPLP